MEKPKIYYRVDIFGNLSDSVLISQYGCLKIPGEERIMKKKVTACPLLIERRKKALEKLLRDNAYQNAEIVKTDLIRGTARVAFDVSLVSELEKNG